MDGSIESTEMASDIDNKTVCGFNLWPSDFATGAVLLPGRAQNQRASVTWSRPLPAVLLSALSLLQSQSTTFILIFTLFLSPVRVFLRLFALIWLRQSVMLESTMAIEHSLSTLWVALWTANVLYDHRRHPCLPKCPTDEHRSRLCITLALGHSPEMLGNGVFPRGDLSSSYTALRFASRAHWDLPVASWHCAIAPPPI